MPQLAVNNALVDYLQVLPRHKTKRGEASKDPIVILHGWNHHAALWQPVAKMLAHDREIFLITHQGHDLLTIIRKLQIDRCILLGHSYGGQVAIRVIEAEPRLVSGLILVASSGLWSHLRMTMKARVFFAMRKWPFYRFLKHLAPSPWRTAVQAEDYKNSTPEMKILFKKIVNTELSQVLPSISIPTLLIWGERDSAVPVRIAKLAHEHLPNSRLEVLYGQEHNLHLDCPELLTQRIQTWLEDLEIQPTRKQKSGGAAQ